jgi:hypothetical protein
MTMKFFPLALLLLAVNAMAELSPGRGQEKPATIQDGAPAQAYVSTAIYEYLDKPPYLSIKAETPFFPKRIAGKDKWISVVEFYCGPSEQEKLHCLTVIVYDPLTRKHKFMTLEQVLEAANKVLI